MECGASYEQQGQAGQQGTTVRCHHGRPKPTLSGRWPARAKHNIKAWSLSKRAQNSKLSCSDW